MADRTHKGTCPIPQCAPASPHPSPDLTGIPGLQGVLPMATFTQPPPPKKNQSLVIPQQTRLAMHKTSHSGSMMEPVVMGTAQDRQYYGMGV